MSCYLASPRGSHNASSSSRKCDAVTKTYWFTRPKLTRAEALMRMVTEKCFFSYIMPLCNVYHGKNLVGPSRFSNFRESSIHDSFGFFQKESQFNELIHFQWCIIIILMILIQYQYLKQQFIITFRSKQFIFDANLDCKLNQFTSKNESPIHDSSQNQDFNPILYSMNRES